MTPAGTPSDGAGGLGGRPVVLDRRPTATGGEVVLRRSSHGFELIVDGSFAMASHLGGRSEVRQVELTLDAADRPTHLLIGGLGLGLALARAVQVPTLTHIVVVEIEPAVIDWHRSWLRELTGAALEDPRVQVVPGDVGDVLLRGATSLDAIVLDVDNGPAWLLRPDNARLYGSAVLDACARRLSAGGACSVWSAQPEPALEHALRQRFLRVTCVEVPVPRGVPDRIHVASGPHERVD